MRFGSASNTGKQPTFSIHILWSNSMNFSNLWKGLAVVAVLFLFSMEASAQLPVRTQNLQLINPAGGTITHTATAAGATGQSYTIVWPEEQDHDNAPNAAGDQAILLGTWAASNTWTLEWVESDGFVDGDGATNHVTFWNPDNNTLESQENFEFDPTTGRLNVGINDIPSVAATILAGTSGSVAIGDGTNAQVQLNVVAGEGTFGNATTAGSVIVTNATGATVGDIDGATATATIGSVGAGAAGTVNVTSAAAAVNGVVLSGANGTATLGNDGITGEVVLYDDGTGVTLNTVQISTGTQTADQVVQFDVPTAAGALGSRFIPLAINQATTADEVLFSNGDGTAEWRTNTADYVQSGVVAMSGAEVPDDGNAYTQFVTFPTDYSTLNPPVLPANISVVIVTNGAAADANVLQIGNITATGFQVLSSAPLAGASINWISMGNP